jgi:protein TonB
VQNVNVNAAPIEAPKEIVMDPPPPPPPPSLSMAGAVGGVAGGVPGGTAGGVVGGIAPPAPPPQPAPVRVGGDIKEPKKIRDARPVYPQIAQSAKVQGIVIIEAIIGKDGTVRDAKVLRSVALLDQAALEAVRQWRYSPTTLNGVPVEVIMTVTVNFTLN